MPRDDLSIDFVGKAQPYNMSRAEQLDCAAVLDEWTNRVANLPAEIAFMQEEIAEKDKHLQDYLLIISKHDQAIQRVIKDKGSHFQNPKEESHRKVINEAYEKAQILQDEKIALALKTQHMVDKHTKYLDQQIKVLQDRGEFPKDPELPSLLNPQPPPARVAPAAIATPLSQINNPVAIPQMRQHPRMPPAVLAHQAIAQSASSAPTTPAANPYIQRARESSLGATNKRLKLSAGSIPATSSGLARHPSQTPGTPRAGTPTTVRAGSAGPRAPKTSTGPKKAPLISRQGGIIRKGKPTKSGLSRVKRTGRNSPSSTNDSELSEAESGSVDEEDEESRAHAGNGAEMEEYTMDIDDEGDNKKYCVCQKVSHGDMVACDNEECPYEWFHWTCVGLTKEPIALSLQVTTNKRAELPRHRNHSMALLSSWEATQRMGEPKAVIRVRNLQTSSKVSKDAWGRSGILQPLLISASVSLHSHFQSASSVDKVDTSTIHYGTLSKAIVQAVEEFNKGIFYTRPDDFDRQDNLRTLIDQIVLFLTTYDLEGRVATAIVSKEPLLLAEKVKSIELQIKLPKAALSGGGVSLKTIVYYEPQSQCPTGHSLALKLHDLSIPTIIGVNAFERLAKQIVVANIEIDEWDLRLDTFNELEQIVVKTIEESEFETLEALAEFLYIRIVKFFLIPLLFADSVDLIPFNSGPMDWEMWKVSKRIRISLEKPTVIPFADAPIVEIMVDAHPERTDSEKVKRAWDGFEKTKAPPFPLQGRLDEWIRKQGGGG